MFTIRVADTFIQINERYQYIKQYCRNYIVDDVTPEMVIEVSDEEIKAEQSDEYTSSPDYLETLAVYRKICERLVDKGIILVHSSVLMVDGEAVMFLAPSGTGKSTHTRLWRQVYEPMSVEFMLMYTEHRGVASMELRIIYLRRLRHYSCLREMRLM